MGRNTIRWDNVSQLDMGGISSLLPEQIPMHQSGKFVLDALKASSETLGKQATDAERLRLFESLKGAENSQQAREAGLGVLANANPRADTSGLFDVLTQAQENVDASNLNEANIGLTNVRSDLFGKQVENYDAESEADRKYRLAAARNQDASARTAEEVIRRQGLQDQAGRLQMEFFAGYEDPMDRVLASLSPEYEQMMLNSNIPVDMFTTTSIGKEIGDFRKELSDASTETIADQMQFNRALSLNQWKDFNYDVNTGHMTLRKSGDSADPTLDKSPNAVAETLIAGGWNRKEAYKFAEKHKDQLSGLINRNNSQNYWQWAARNLATNSQGDFAPDTFIAQVRDDLIDKQQMGTNRLSSMQRLRQANILGATAGGATPSPAAVAQEIAADAAEQREAVINDPQAPYEVREEAISAKFDDSIKSLRSSVESAVDVPLAEVVKYLKDDAAAKAPEIKYGINAGMGPAIPHSREAAQIEKFMKLVGQADNENLSMPMRVQALRKAKEMHAKVLQTVRGSYSDLEASRNKRLSETNAVLDNLDQLINRNNKD